MKSHSAPWLSVPAVVIAAALMSCASPMDARSPELPSDSTFAKSVVLLVTPKMLPDFSNPSAAITQFFDNYKSLTSQAAEVIVIFSVGNSDHILNYRGAKYWQDTLEWARTTDFVPVSDRVIDYNQLAGIVRVFKTVGVAQGVNLKVYDQIDSGGEFTISSKFKYGVHLECTVNRWGMFDIRGQLQSDRYVYATAPQGIAEGTLCGDFLADQVAQYTKDLDFDGILFDNQLGTRGRWHEGDGPGYTEEEAKAISAFLQHSRRVLGGRGLMWFDSYNNVQVERNTFSFPADGYGYFDYLIASGFCVMTEDKPYTDNLNSKLQIQNGPKILATLDYVDPWYTYNSMFDYPACSAQLEQTAIAYRNQIDGIMFFANDERGALIPKQIIDSFAARFFGT